MAFALVLLTLLPPPLVTSTIDHTTELLRLHPISQTASQLTTWLPQPKIAHAAPSLVLSVNVNPANAEPGDRVVFTIRYRCASLTEHCLNTVIDHTLPTGMEIVKFSPSGGLIDTASFFGQTVTWTLQSLGSPAGQLDAGSTGMVRVVGRWETCGTAVTASTYTATANINITGGANTANANVTLDTDIPASCPTAPPTTTDLVKYSASGSVVTVNGHNTFRITMPDAASAYTVTDVIPAGAVVTQIHERGAETFDFQCGSNATWHHVTLGSLTAHVETNGLPAGCVSWRRPNGEDLFNVVAVRWQMATTPGSSDPELRLHYPETTPFTDAELPGFTPVGIGDTYTNCVQSSDTSMGNAGESCATLNVLPADPRTRMDKDVMAAPDINADTNPVPSSDTDIRDFTLDPDAVPPMTMGDSDILYGVEIGANSSGTDWLNPVVTDLLPDELEYVPYADGGTNFWQVVRYYADGILASDPANQPDCLTPTFTIEENWNGTGRTLLKWEFFNCTFYSSGLNLARLNLYFSTRIKAGTLAGTLIDNYANNGMPDDPLANNNATYTVPEIANMQSSKWVQGKLDSSFSRYPLFGDTDTTGEGVYEFFIENTGNVEVTQFDVVDILPEVGDEDVLAVIGARESEWNLELASDITVERWNSGTSTWDVVPASDMALGPYYSTTTNPCRFVNDPSNNEDLTADESAAAATINTVACDTPNWNSTAPDARSFAFRFSPASSFMPGEQLKVTVNVRLNGVVAANNEIAWNSFAFGGIYLNSLNASTDLLATEPIKVGLRMVDTSNFTSLGNKVWHDVNANGQQDDGEPALAGVTVSLYDDDGGGNPVDADGNATNGTTPRDVTLTDSNGFYRFDGLNPNDDFIIRIDNDNDFSTILHGYGPTTANQGDDTTDSDATTDSDGYPSIAASTGAVTGVDDPADPSEYPTNDFGFVQVASIGNYVWYDLDGQGDQSDGEPPVWGAQVGLYTSTDVQVGITLTTDANGYYLFENVPIGDYYLVFNTGSISGTDPISPALTVAPADWVLTGAGTTGDDTNDSDPDGTGRTSLTSLTAGEVDLTWDAGLVAAPTDPAALTGIVWEDLTPNNTYDIGEPLLSGITMQLLDSNGIPIATQQTDSTGTYYFGNLTPGETYSVVVVPNLGQTLVTADQGGDDAIDSDFNQTTGESTASYTPAANETIIDVDAGIVSPLSLGNMVWSDVNDNGQLDSGEAGIEGILVTLLDDTGSTILMTTTTDANGRYLFTNLSADDYVVRAEVPANMRSSTDIGTTVTPNPTDSDDNGQGIADTGSVQSVAVTLANSGGPTGEADHGVLIDGVLDTTPDVKAYYTVDFGFVPLVKIGDRIWYESDNDGLASTGVITPASSITVNAIDDTGDSYSATTNSSGYYSITVPTNRIYTLTVTTPPGYAPSTVVANAANNENHDASGTVVSVGTVDDLTLDFGFTFSPNVGEACVGNLLTNGSFELGTHTGGTAWAGGSQLTVSTSSGGTSPTGWYRDNSTGGAHYWVDNTNAYSGTKYVYAALNTPIALQDGVQIRPDASVAVQPSTSYQFCAWAADGTANGLESGIAFIVDEDSAPLHYQTHIVPDNGAWDFGATTVIPWAQYCYNFTTDAATTSLDLWVSNADVGGNHSRIVFDEVCLAEITPTVNIGNFVWFDADG
ncbi:MAG: SdrD B-like domain-containing protein, partial [Chloroflexota bacterium]